MTEQRLTIDNNTCIISSNLLDELDYIVGGYGTPTIESIFNFNAFVEAYILSSNFVMTEHEFRHIQITRKVLFPNGRPIFELIAKSKKFSLLGGFGNNLARAVYVEKITQPSNEIAAKHIDTFGERDHALIKQSLILSDFNNPIEDVKTFSLGFVGSEQEEFGNKSQIIIGQSSNNPFEIVKLFFNTITNFNVQAALPVFTYKQQFFELNKKAISKEIYKTICDIQGQNIEDAEQYLGSEIQTIPPLVSIIFSKAKSREDIPNVLTEIREDFTEFRNCCEKFEENLNEAKTIKEQIDAIKDYKKFWATLVKKYTDKNSRIMFRFLDIAKESDYQNALDSAIDSQSADDVFKDLNMGKVAGKAAFLGWDKIKEKRILNKFKGVVNLWSLLENAPALNIQIKDIERIFGGQIDRNKILIAKNHLDQIRQTAPNSGFERKCGWTEQQSAVNR